MLINVSDARRMLADLLKRAARGDDIVIAKGGRPVARLVPVEDGSSRRPGLAEGRVTEAFFEPLPDEEMAAWQQ
jgi:prevent-host-death family protein